MNIENNSLEKKYKKLNKEEGKIIKKWNEGLGYKIILLFPLLIFLITFLRVNIDKSLFDLLNFIFIGCILVLGGILLNFLLSRK